MTAVDGDPLTGDPTDPTVRHLLALVRPRIRPTPTPVPVIHEPCGLTQCGGCSSRGCVSRRPAPTPVTIQARWYESDAHIDGSNS